MTDETTARETNLDAPADPRTVDLERRLAEMETQSTARIILAELKAAAAVAGMVDLDGVKLIDRSALRLNQSGELDDAPAIVAELRKAKPWLFGGASSSSAASPPPPRPPRPKLATEMTYDEWQLARGELLRRR